jgi:hypothetical protein
VSCHEPRPYLHGDPGVVDVVVVAPEVAVAGQLVVRHVVLRVGRTQVRRPAARMHIPTRVDPSVCGRTKACTHTPPSLF